MSLYRNGFQTFVNTVNPPSVEGSFASQNPRATVLAGAGALKSDSTNPPRVGYFARALNGLASAIVSPGEGVLGFVANELQSIITAFLGQERMQTQAGFPITLFSHGDFWAFVAGATAANVGDPVFAVAGTGQPTMDDDSNANPDTGFILASAPAASASGAGNVSVAANTGIMTVAATITGTLETGQVISGTGVPANTFILAQLSGTAGAGSGATYLLNYQGAAIPTFTNLTASSGQLVKISRTY